MRRANGEAPTMDQAAALLMALRAAAGLSGNRLEPARVEAHAGLLGLKSEDLPALVTRWQQAGQVMIHWGGVLELLPETAGSTSLIINAQGATFGPGATLAGRDATGGTVTITPEAAFGSLAAVIAKLQEIRPRLQGAAAEAAEVAEQSLTARPAAEAPAEVRRSWVSNAGGWLGRLLTAAPEVKDVVELGDKALKGLGWG
jgi:hypothetical protein